jgi:hypothetical protein
MITSYIADGFRSTGARAGAYERFWPFFMERHMHPWTRYLHVVATLVGMSCALIAFPLTLNSMWLIYGFVLPYPIAWVSHAFFERRKPAAFVNPYWSFLADVDMMILLFLGRLDADVERIRRFPELTSGAVRRAWHLACELFVAAYVSAIALLEYLQMTSFSFPF